MYSLYSLSKNLYEVGRLKDLIIENVSKIYSEKFKISAEELKRYLKSIPVYVKNLGKNVLGAYSFYTDGKSIYNRKIEISPLALSNSYFLIKTLAEEYVHAAQSYLGFVKRIPYYFFNFFRKIRNIIDYITHPLEREAKYVANKITKEVYKNSFINLLKNLYERMYIL